MSFREWLSTEGLQVRDFRISESEGYMVVLCGVMLRSGLSERTCCATGPTKEAAEKYLAEVVSGSQLVIYLPRRNMMRLVRKKHRSKRNGHGCCLGRKARKHLAVQRANRAPAPQITPSRFEEHVFRAPIFEVDGVVAA